MELNIKLNTPITKTFIKKLTKIHTPRSLRSVRKTKYFLPHNDSSQGGATI